MNEKQAKNFFFEMNDIFNKVGLRYFLFLGTLLGAIREQRFIPIDKDFDIGVFKEEFDLKKDELKAEFEKNGFETKWKFNNSKEEEKNNPVGLGIYKGLVEVGKKRKMHCDICAFIKLKKWRYYPRAGKSRKVLAYLSKIIGKLKDIEFYGRKVKVPFYTEKFLELTYGKDWRTPHTKFKAESGIGSQFLPESGNEFWWAEE